MAQYLSFDEVASKLKCNVKKVRQLVIEDKSMRATRITPNGLVLTECGLDGHFPYDLDFNCHLDDEGSITSDIYRIGANGGTEKTKTLFVGYLRVEYSELARFVTEAEFAHLSRESTLTTTPDALQVQSSATPDVVQGNETKEQRQDRRLKACEDAGLSFKDYKGRLPDGVGDVADREGVTRQAFSTDVKAALERRASAQREGTTVHRA